jgi:small-conductance mechanosensitive channel
MGSILTRLAVTLGLMLAAFCLPLQAAEPKKDAAPAVTLNLPPDASPDYIARVVAALQAAGLSVNVQADNKPLAAATRPMAAMEVDNLLTAARQSAEVAIDNLGGVATLPGFWLDQLQPTGGSLLLAILRALLVLAVASAIETAYRRMFRRWRQRVVEDTPVGYKAKLRNAGELLAYDLIGVGIFYVVLRIALPVLHLAEPNRLNVEAIMLGIIIARLHLAFGRLLFAPDRPHVALVPFADPRRAYRWFAVYAIGDPLLVMSQSLLSWLHAPEGPFTAYVFVTGTIITIYRVILFLVLHRQVSAAILCSGENPDAPGLMRRLVAASWYVVYIALSLLIWLLEIAAPSMGRADAAAVAASRTLVVAVAVPLLALGYVRLMSALFRTPDGVEQPMKWRGVEVLAVRLGGGLFWIGGILLIASFWGADPFNMSDSMGAATTRGVLALAGAALIGWVLWMLTDVVLPVQNAKTRPFDPEAGSVVQAGSRFTTMMPLLRGFTRAAIFVLVALIVLSSLGLDIGPLLAGAGVIGLALSFGSQALVRDIVSGIFFMLDDAFRVGEYIDTGKLKGTVEHLSLRSLQLRHQNGQLHTIPYGQLASVSNFSRDWATIKFNLRLVRDSDLELVRRTIKQIGQSMLQEPALKEELLAPLKLQGVADIVDNALVVRLKFTAKPNKPSWVQREAIKRIYHAFREKGIQFASNAVTVQTVGGAGDAVAGAAAVAASMRDDAAAAS